MKSLIRVLLLLSSLQVHGADNRPCTPVLLYDENLLDFYNKGKTICDKLLDTLLTDYAKDKISKVCQEKRADLPAEQNCGDKCSAKAMVGFDESLAKFPIYDKSDCQPTKDSNNYKLLVDKLVKQLKEMEAREKSVSDRFLELCGTNKPPEFGNEDPDKRAICINAKAYESWKNQSRSMISRSIYDVENLENRLALQEREKSDWTRDYMKPANITARELKAKQNAEFAASEKIRIDAKNAAFDEQARQERKTLAVELAKKEKEAAAAEKLKTQKTAYCSSLKNKDGNVLSGNEGKFAASCVEE